jgi:3-dehydroquinate dehydratase-1
VGVISTPAGLRLLTKKSLPVELCEVRLDILCAKGVTLNTLLPLLKKRKHPVILTPRSPKEGGVYKWKAREREIVSTLLLPYVDWIDLELRELDSLKEIYDTALRLKARPVLSAHFFNSTPPEKELRKIVKQFQRRKAGCYKIAARLQKPADLFNLAAILRDNPRNEWALMGMGTEATRSRVVLSLLGSRLVYGYLDKPTAPGQQSIRQISRLLTELF